MVTKAYSILFAILLSTVLPANASPETDYIDGELAAIQVEFSVLIHYHYETSLYFPSEWQTPSLALAASEIDVNEVIRLIPIIRQFLVAHPAAVVRTDLEHIYLLRELSFRGKSYGGTHKDRSIYITCNGVENLYDDAFMLRRLHSEFSSILRDYHTFPTHSWNQLNPEGFSYSGNGFEVLGRPSLYDFTEQDRAEGFLLIYSQSSLENDFNMLSSWLFTKRGELDDVSLKYEKIQQKQALTEQFYSSISGQYSFN